MPLSNSVALTLPLGCETNALEGNKNAQCQMRILFLMTSPFVRVPRKESWYLLNDAYLLGFLLYEKAPPRYAKNTIFERRKSLKYRTIFKKYFNTFN